MNRIQWLLLIVVAASGMVLLAQSRGTINGRITDQTGAIVAQAKVTAQNTATGISRESVSNADGLYSFAALDPGTYEIKVEATGFTSMTRRVNLVTDTTLDIDFSIGVGEVKQEVSVTGEAALVETSQSGTSGALTTTEV